jgi:outer membrane protein assembly factor BamB
VLIVTVCPRCRSKYTVGDVLIGKEIRCLNNDCGLSFIVGGTEEPATTTSSPSQSQRAPAPGTLPPKQWSGSVNDMLPVLDAEEVVDPVESEYPGKADHVSNFIPLVEAEVAPTSRKPIEVSWDQPPPVRNPQARLVPPPPPPPAPPARKKPASRPKAPDTPPVAASSKASPPAPAGDNDVAFVEPSTEPGPETTIPEPELVAETAKQQPASSTDEPTISSWEADAPPVRRGDGALEAEFAADATALLVDEAPHPGARRKRFSLFAIIGGGAFVTAIAVAVVFAVIAILGQREGSLAAAAYQAFEHKQYSNAGQDFKELQVKFGASSKRVDEYRTMEELSNVLATATSASGPEEAVNSLEALRTLAINRKDDPVLKPRATALSNVGSTLVGTITNAEKENPSEATPARLDKVASIVAEVSASGSYLFDSGFRDKVTTEISEARSIHRIWAARASARQKVLALLDPGALPPIQAYKAVRELLRKDEREFPGFRDDPTIKSALENLYKRHQDSVEFEPGGAAAKPTGSSGEIPGTTLYFDPRIDDATAGTTPPRENEDVVLSVVRGVLYAHSKSNGHTLWCERVGVDTTTLPVRIAATSTSLERILVMLADSSTLLALSPQGEVVWRYPMGSPCLGRPVVIDSTVYLSTYDGHIHEVELSGGARIGLWNLGQALSCGGVREGNSKTVYFPADDTCIYVLNVDPTNRSCVRILYSNHPSGSLRGEPIVIPPTKRNIQNQVDLPGYLVLNQSDGLDRTQIRVFPLPLTDRDGPPSKCPVPHLLGWPWFKSLHDPEKMAIVTDAGLLGIFGFRQYENHDADLFSYGTLNLDTILKPEGGTRGRAQIGAAQGDNLWVLSSGKLQRFERVSTVSAGPKLIPVWPNPLSVGSPLNECQVVTDRNTDEMDLVFVTQELKRQACEVTAVRSEDGLVRWQRRIGLVCQGVPLLLNGPVARPAEETAPADDQKTAAAPAAPAEPVLLSLGQSGDLFGIDPAGLQKKDSAWQSAGQFLVAGPLDDNPSKLPVLLSAGEHGSFEVAFPGTGNVLVLRHITFDPATRQAKLAGEQEVKLPTAAVPAGPPVIVGHWLVVPLTNGVVFSVSLTPPGAMKKEGSNWRSPRLGSDARCYITPLGPDRFVATDGDKGLTFWKMSESGIMSALFRSDKPDEDSLGFELDDRIVAPPVLLAEPGGKMRLFVADGVNLLRTVTIGENSAKKDAEFQWDLTGRITAGPFLRKVPGAGMRIGCVLEGKRLVWIDPYKPKDLLWTHATAGAAIVGDPQVVGSRIVVADQGGTIVSLDPASGQKRGERYTLPGSVAPTAPPVQFSRERLFVPLTDGTVALLPLTIFK